MTNNNRKHNEHNLFSENTLHTHLIGKLARFSTCFLAAKAGKDVMSALKDCLLCLKWWDIKMYSHHDPQQLPLSIHFHFGFTNKSL